MSATETKVEAAARPWHRAGNEDVAYIVDNDRELIYELIGAGDTYSQKDIANIDLTLRAVNNHDALVSDCVTLKEQRQQLLTALEVAQSHACSLLCPSVKKTGEEWTHSKECQQISAAIAKAKGEQ